MGFECRMMGDIIYVLVSISIVTPLSKSRFASECYVLTPAEAQLRRIRNVLKVLAPPVELLTRRQVRTRLHCVR